MRSILILAALLVGAPPAQAQQASWPEQKCAAYQTAWNQALDAFGTDGMNYAFIAGNENFIASGCESHAPVCPQSTAELEIANALTLAMMNAGAASTFLPFRCAAPETTDGWTGSGL
jgi:hypothetical protein